MDSNLVANKRLDHIDLMYHLIRHYANEGSIKLEDTGNEHNVADIVTKSIKTEAQLLHQHAFAG